MGKIYVGTSGWTYPPWRGSFYPKGVTQKQELNYASRQVNSIEINGTFYCGGGVRPLRFEIAIHGRPHFRFYLCENAWSGTGIQKSYPDAFLKSWTTKIKGWTKKRDAFIYFDTLSHIKTTIATSDSTLSTT